MRHLDSGAYPSVPSPNGQPKALAQSLDPLLLDLHQLGAVHLCFQAGGRLQ